MVISTEEVIQKLLSASGNNPQEAGRLFFQAKYPPST